MVRKDDCHRFNSECSLTRDPILPLQPPKSTSSRSVVPRAVLVFPFLTGIGSSHHLKLFDYSHSVVDIDRLDF